jgi:SAM-dependent methyltransferase
MTFSGAVATAYAAHRRGYPPPVVDLLVRTLDLPRSSLVLDLGCGTGQLTVPLAGAYERVVGADPSADMLVLARATGAPVAWLLADDADVARLPLLAGLDAVTIAQAIHLLDRPPLFRALAERMSPLGRIAVVANGNPMWLRDLDWSRALKAYLERGWAGRCGRPAGRTPPPGPGSGPSWRPPASGTRSRSATTTARPTPFERIAGNVYSALSPSQLPDGPGFEDGLREAIGPGPFEEDITVSILVARRTGTMAS